MFGELDAAVRRPLDLSKDGTRFDSRNSARPKSSQCKIVVSVVWYVNWSPWFFSEDHKQRSENGLPAQRQKASKARTKDSFI